MSLHTQTWEERSLKYLVFQQVVKVVDFGVVRAQTQSGVMTQLKLEHTVGWLLRYGFSWTSMFLPDWFFWWHHLSWCNTNSRSVFVYGTHLCFVYLKNEKYDGHEKQWRVIFIYIFWLCGEREVELKCKKSIRGEIQF